MGIKNGKVFKLENKAELMEVKKVDSKGRIYLGSEFAGKKLYVIRIFDSLFITDSEEKANEIERKKEEFLREGIEKLFDFLGEPSIEEIKGAVERLRKRKFSSIQM
ncbi:hypothetical protein SACC_27890 [Saccharolobus caldissimus]|uniref:VapB-type antitoxin n=2 Tax=Saccharolobus caldissimus TaxID=1702097 RepID=A0AAQ4CVE1_9CREN|nr:hypothetical protein SACC_27890 [Saccharolobus caldissimus]